MKRGNNIFEKIISVDNLRKALHESRCSSKRKIKNKKNKEKK